MVPTRGSSKEFNHNSQKLHTLLIKTCEAKPIYSANKSFINGGQPQFSKASHTLDQDNVKQNQFIVPTRASSNEFNHNSQKVHTLLIKTCEAKPIYGANKSFINGGQPQFSKASHILDQTMWSKTNLWCQQELHQWRATIIFKSFTHSLSRQCEAKPIYGANKSFIKRVQPQLSKVSHTLDQDSVKQNQFMVPTRASSIEGNHNSQKFHTLLIKTV
ncbi:unnamed protein product [Malus baccata var. baccata]